MNGAYAYLVARSLRNRLTRQVARLRSPRYLLALLLGLAYLSLIVGQQHSAPTPPSAETSRWAELLLAERRALVELRDRKVIGDEVLSRLEHELNLEAMRAGLGEALVGPATTPRPR